MPSTILCTLTTADNFQHYLPLYHYAARRYCGPDVVIRTAVMGGLVDELTTQAFKVLGVDIPRESPLPPNTPPLGGKGHFQVDWLPLPDSRKSRPSKRLRRCVHG